MELLANGRVTLYCGDCIEVMNGLSENSVDSIVCDPPYHLTSIVKRFGADNAAPAKHGTDGAFARASRGFMGKQWDGGDVAFRPETWRAALRVLKPGGYLLAFSGTRTYDQMVSAIREAGFEIRDMIAWMYGSGFPKNHNVSKAINWHLGAEREKVRIKTHGRIGSANTVGGDTNGSDTPATPEAAEWEGYGTALKPALEPICMARKPLIGTIAANVLAHGTGALNIDGCRVGTEKTITVRNGNSGGQTAFGRDERKFERENPEGRWPANVIHDGSPEVVELFPDQKSPGTYNRSTAAQGEWLHRKESGTQQIGFGDSGSAARFFYTSKADADDRLGSKHPTVKPLDLMQYLVRLVTPKGGVVLDCFAGTGTTGEAALREGMRAVLIEREAEYQADIRRRMALLLGGTEERRRESIKASGKIDHDAGPLFSR